MTTEPNETALMAPGTDLGLMTTEQIDATVNQIERACEAKRRIILAVMKMTYPKDFIDFGGRPYLTGDGARRLLPAGIALSEPAFDRTEEGDDLIVECMLTATWVFMGQLLTATEIGGCSTLDKLYHSPDEEKRTTYAQLLEQAGGNVRIAKRALFLNIKKKALKNATSRAVSAVMGLGGLTWEQLGELGYTAEGSGGQVAFKKGATRASTSRAKSATGFATVPELLKMSQGSVVSTSGTLVHADKRPTYHKYTIEDMGAQVVLQQWSADPLPGWVKPGVVADFGTVEVKEYQGRPQYITDDIQPGQDSEPEDDLPEAPSDA